MGKTVLKCGLVGGLIVFIWMTVSWMVLPWHKMCFNTFMNEEEVQDVIRENAPVSGIYILPNAHAIDKQNKGQMQREMDLFKQGPVMFASVVTDGIYNMSLKPVIISLITELVGGLIIAWMLLHQKYKEFKKQVLFVMLIGFLVGLLGILPGWTWWSYSACYTIVLWADLVIGWFLAGLAMAKLSRR